MSEDARSAGLLHGQGLLHGHGQRHGNCSCYLRLRLCWNPQHRLLLCCGGVARGEQSREQWPSTAPFVEVDRDPTAAAAEGDPQTKAEAETQTKNAVELVLDFSCRPDLQPPAIVGDGVAKTGLEQAADQPHNLWQHARRERGHKRLQRKLWLRIATHSAAAPQAQAQDRRRTGFGRYTQLHYSNQVDRIDTQTTNADTSTPSKQRDRYGVTVTPNATITHCGYASLMLHVTGLYALRPETLQLTVNLVTL